MYHRISRRQIYRKKIKKNFSHTDIIKMNGYATSSRGHTPTDRYYFNTILLRLPKTYGTITLLVIFIIIEL